MCGKAEPPVRWQKKKPVEIRQLRVEFPVLTPGILQDVLVVLGWLVWGFGVVFFFFSLFISSFYSYLFPVFHFCGVPTSMLGFSITGKIFNKNCILGLNVN